MQFSAVLKARIEATLGAPYLTWREAPPLECLPSGIAEVDALTGGLPRGAITDLYGPPSSGRTSMLVSALAEATARQEVCALVDASDTFDPASAAAAGADLDRLLWVRCGGRPDSALKSADMIIQAGGFGLIALDLADVPPAITRRIPLASWFRCRRAIENTPSALVVVEREPTVKSCAALILEARKERIAWSGAPNCSRLLRGLRVDVTPHKPVRPHAAAFEARAIA